MEGCQFIGSEQRNYPFTMCGCKPFPGRVYCEEHIWTVYKKGTSSGNKRKIAAIEKSITAELAELKRQQEIAESEGIDV